MTNFIANCDRSTWQLSTRKKVWQAKLFSRSFYPRPPLTATVAQSCHLICNNNFSPATVTFLATITFFWQLFVALWVGGEVVGFRWKVWKCWKVLDCWKVNFPTTTGNIATKTLMLTVDKENLLLSRKSYCCKEKIIVANEKLLSKKKFSLQGKLLLQGKSYCCILMAALGHRRQLYNMNKKFNNWSEYGSFFVIYFLKGVQYEYTSASLSDKATKKNH